MAIAIPSYGTLLQMDDGALNFTTIAGIKDPGTFQRSANMVDVTEHNAGSPWREFRPTLLTCGAITLNLNWVATNATHAYTGNGLGAVFNTRAKRTFRWVNNSDAGADYHQVEGYISQISETAPVDNVYSGQVQLTPTGAPTWVTT